MTSRARDVVSVSFGSTNLQAARIALEDIPKAFDKAVPAAVNKTLAKTQTFARKRLTTLLTLKARNLKRRLFVKKASVTKPEAFLQVMGRPIGLVNFAAKDMRKSKQGVRYQLYRGGSPEFEERGFIATGKFGNRHAFERRGKRRLPIDTLYSPSLYYLLNKVKLPDELTAFVAKDLPVQLRGQVSRFLKTRKS